MTIARRILLLAGTAPLVLIVLGGLTHLELARIESRSRFVAETQVPSLSALGNVSGTFVEMRVALRDHVLAQDAAGQARSRQAVAARRAELDQRLRQYADALVSDDRDRRLLDEFRALSDRWSSAAGEVMALAEGGRRDEAARLLASDPVTELGARVGESLRDWIAHNQVLAAGAGEAVVAGLQDARRHSRLALALGLILSAGLGFLTFRKIVGPVRGLRGSVESIAGGDFGATVPFTGAADETGSLARSIEVLRRGAGAMEDQRWVKSNVATLTGALQGAATLTEFGERLLSGLVPLLGGGVAGFYALPPGETRLRRMADYGLAESARLQEWIALGEGLAGQCAREGKPVHLAGLPPDYLHVSSGLGGAAPVQAEAWPLASRETVLAVVEVASFRAPSARERALLEELLPAAALNLEVLQRNLSTQELLCRPGTRPRSWRPSSRASGAPTSACRRPSSSTAACSTGAGRARWSPTRTASSSWRTRSVRTLRLPARGAGRAAARVLVPDDVPPASPELRQSFRRPAAPRTMGAGREIAALRKDGSLFPVEIGLSPLPARGSGEGAQAAVSVRDVTERKEQESALMGPRPRPRKPPR